MNILSIKTFNNIKRKSHIHIQKRYMQSWLSKLCNTLPKPPIPGAPQRGLCVKVGVSLKNKNGKGSSTNSQEENNVDKKLKEPDSNQPQPAETTQSPIAVTPPATTTDPNSQFTENSNIPLQTPSHLSPETLQKNMEYYNSQTNGHPGLFLIKPNGEIEAIATISSSPQMPPRFGSIKGVKIPYPGDKPCYAYPLKKPVSLESTKVKTFIDITKGGTPEELDVIKKVNDQREINFPVNDKESNNPY